MNWHDILPPDVADKQVDFELDRTAYRMRTLANLTFKQVGEKMGETAHLARTRFERYERHYVRGTLKMPPAEKYINTPGWFEFVA